MSYLPPCRQTFWNSVATLSTGGPTVEIPWVTKADTINDDLLDLTVPTAPVVRQAGFYVVTAWFSVIPVTDPTQGYVVGQVDLDYDGEDAYQRVQISWELTGVVPCNVSYYIPAGGSLRALVTNSMGDGVGNVDANVRLNAWLLRLPV